MGGKSGGGDGGSEIIDQLRAKQIAQSEELWASNKPLMQEAVAQMSHMQNTGSGRGLKIVEDAIAGQQAAALNAQNQTVEAMSRVPVGDPSFDRIMEEMAFEQNANIDQLGVRIGGPMVFAGMNNALGGSGAAQRSLSGAMGALTPEAEGGGTDWGALGKQGGDLAYMIKKKGMGSLGAKATAGKHTGSGINPHTGGMIVGSTGMMGGGV